jgi:hypothetical protein
MKFSHRVVASFVAWAVGSSLLLGSSDSKAGSAGNVPITRIDVWAGTFPLDATASARQGTNGVVILTFGLNLNNTAQPACASSNLRSMAFDASTAQGKAWLALAQSAFLAGRNVQIVGIGSTAVTGITSQCVNITPILQMSGMPSGNIERMMQLEVL